MTVAGSAVGPPAFERHFTVKELAALWRLSEDTVRRCFQKEPGVVEIKGRQGTTSRKYTTLRIPESVTIRVHRKISLVSKH